MNLTVTRLNGTTYSLADYGIKTLDFVIDSPSPRHETEIIDGADGFIDMGTTYDGRSMRGSFMMYAVDLADYPLLRNEVFRMFASKEAFYLVDDREPGKRWLVKVASAFSMEQMRKFGRFEVEFISASPYAESEKSTLEDGFDPTYYFGSATSMIPISQYTINGAGTTNFQILNGGDVATDPRRQYIKVEYDGVLPAELSIRNNTTGEVWTYTTGASAGATARVKLDGVRYVKNDIVSIFSLTNRKFFTIAPGMNDFTVIGGSSYVITFDFRFYLL
ncbi:phage tail family protein [Bacillus idriensis]|uniref:Phage tail family protein n=1 Tax=Metabacillus idriensis TaxID=324768 RepID=A0A6I2MCF8_9BACI|nr:phage tail domain-containing protein [Metabacillus idriensis]MRX54706.1 phage tail family protein [Metabacillus idriensis]